MSCLVGCRYINGAARSQLSAPSCLFNPAHLTSLRRDTRHDAFNHPPPCHQLLQPLPPYFHPFHLPRLWYSRFSRRTIYSRPIGKILRPFWISDLPLLHRPQSLFADAACQGRSCHSWSREACLAQRTGCLGGKGGRGLELEAGSAECGGERVGDPT